MLHKNKISIIVPIFNAERYIDICISSLIKQSYLNIEIILVNDGSTDNSINIINNYQVFYKNILVINNKNEGPGFARNAGLDLATGDFIMFLDVDDYITHDCCERIVSYMEDSVADFACFGAKFMSSESLEASSFAYLYEEIYNSEILNNYLLIGKIKNVVWNKVYRKSLIDKYSIRFSNNRINEDALFVMSVALNSKFIKLIPGIFYIHTSTNPFSFSNNVTSEHFLSLLNVLNAEKSMLCDKGIFESYEKPYRIHAAKLLTHMFFLGAIKITTYREFKSSLYLIYNSEIWANLRDVKYLNFPILLSFRIFLCHNSLFFWHFVKFVKIFLIIRKKISTFLVS